MISGGNFPFTAIVSSGMPRLTRSARHSSWALILLLIVVPLFAIPPSRPSNTPSIIAFVNVSVVAMDHDGMVREQTVLVRGATISEIGPTSAIKIPAHALVIDGSGRYLLPGLADMHVHLNSFVHARPNFGDAALFLAYGVTTVLNLSGERALLDCRERIRTGELLAPNLYTSGEFINEPSERTPAEVEREVERQFGEGYDAIKYHQIVDEEGRYITTTGLSWPAYMRMNEVARRLGMPLVGHAPMHLGFNTLLEAHQSLAHIGELVQLCFLPPDPSSMNLFLLASTTTLLVLIFSCFLWISIYGRKSTLPVRPTTDSSFCRTILALATVALFSMVSSVALILTGNRPLLLLATIPFVVMLGSSIQMFIPAAKGWRVYPTRAKLHAAVLMIAASGFLAATSYWLPILWRSSDAEVAHVAASAHKSGIWVETTLNLYDTMGLRPQQRAKLLQGPAFKALPPDIREDWTVAAGQDLLPKWQMIVFRNYPRFTRTLTGALHQAGVPLLLGTDAMGAPLAIPGASAHQELQLLIESGLSPYEALRTATVNPAKFLGKQAEFGTITVGKRADLLLVSADPLVDIDTLNAPVGVMLRGQWLPSEKLRQMLLALASETDKSQ